MLESVQKAQFLEPSKNAIYIFDIDSPPIVKQGGRIQEDFTYMEKAHKLREKLQCSNHLHIPLHFMIFSKEKSSKLVQYSAREPRIYGL